MCHWCETVRGVGFTFPGRIFFRIKLKIKACQLNFKTWHCLCGRCQFFTRMQSQISHFKIWLWNIEFKKMVGRRCEVRGVWCHSRNLSCMSHLHIHPLNWDVRLYYIYRCIPWTNQYLHIHITATTASSIMCDDTSSSFSSSSSDSDYDHDAMTDLQDILFELGTLQEFAQIAASTMDEQRRAELRADKHGLALNDNLTTDTARPGFMGTTRWLLLAID